MTKKSTYAVLGGLMLALATILGRVDGGGLDLVLLVLIGVMLLIASADVPTKQRQAS